MNIKAIQTIIILLLSLLMSEALAFKALDDQRLHAITAGNASEYDSSLALARIPLHFSRDNIDVEGDIIVLPASSYSSDANLQLQDNAQGNLRSLININAVNSPINVLLNLNINVDSHIDKIIQMNSLFPD